MTKEVMCYKRADGLELIVNETKSSVTGFLNVTFSKAPWSTTDGDVYPFVVAFPRGNIPKNLDHMVEHKDTDQVCFGSYDCPMKAALVAALVREDMKYMLKNHQNKAVVTQFPSDLKLDEAGDTIHYPLSLNKAKKEIKKVMKAREAKKAKLEATMVTVEIDGRMLKLKCDDPLAVKCVARDKNRGFKRITDLTYDEFVTYEDALANGEYNSTIYSVHHASEELPYMWR